MTRCDRVAGDLDIAVDHQHRPFGVLGREGETGTGIELHVGVEQWRGARHRRGRAEARADEQPDGHAAVTDRRQIGGRGVLERWRDLLGLVGQGDPRLQPGER